MRRLYFIAFLFVFINHINAQHPNNTNDESNVIKCSVYEYGVPITCAEDNFKNLFNNLNGANFVNGHDFELLDYNYLFTIVGREGQVNADFLINTIFSADSITIATSILSVGRSSSRSLADKIFHGVDLQTQEVRFSTIEAKSYSLINENSRLLFELFVLGIMREEGGEVYSINWKYKGKEIRSYVICDGKTHRVVWDLVFKNCVFWAFLDE